MGVKFLDGMLMSNNQILDPLGKSNLPKLRFSASSNNKGWKKIFLSSISKNLDNLRVPITSLNRENGKIPYYGASGIVDYVNDFIFDDDLLCISEDGANLLARVYPIAFSVSGKSWINNHAHVLKFNNKEQQVIVEAYLNSISLEDYLTGMAQPKLNKAMLNKIPLYLPTEAEEQKKLASFITSLNALLDKELNKLNSLINHKNGLLQQLFPNNGENSPKLRLGKFSQEWETIELSQITKPVKEKNSNGDEIKVLSLSNEHGLVSQADYFLKKVAGDNTERYIVLKKNDFVYNDRITKNSTYGTIKRLSLYESGIVSPIYKCFRFEKNQNPVFWEYFFESKTHESEIKQIVNEGARAGRYNISIDKFLSINVLQPSLLEQEKIACCLTSLDRLISNQTNYIEQLKKHKIGLMQQLFPVVEEI